MSDVNSWLTGLGLGKYCSAFASAEVDFETLPDLTENDLKELGLPLGPRRKILMGIQRLGMTSNSVETPITAAASSADSFACNTSSDAERRHLTVMFVDLVGSTAMASRIDPEDMHHVITNYQNTVAGVVARFEGFVAKFMGDGVLCYFGWPRANEDDAVRAVLAGLAMIEDVSRCHEPNGNALSTRIGIATGVVVVGDMIGSGAAQEAAVVGETPNLGRSIARVGETQRISAAE